MLTARLMGNSLVEKAIVADPTPAPGEVIIKVMTSALCGSEMGAYRTTLTGNGRPEPRYDNMGHELVGEVVDANGQSLLPAGSRVAVNIITGCGVCNQCRSGDRRFCKDQWYVFNGHSEYLNVPAYTCMPLPDQIDYETGVLIGGDTLGVGARALRFATIRPKDRVLVVGAGPVGLGFVALLAHMGLETVVSEPSAYRRDMVRKMGATAIDPLAGEAKDQLMAATNGHRIDLAIDASGRSDGVVFALESLRPFGQMIFAGAGHQAAINPWSHFLEREVSARGVWYFTDADYFVLLDLYEKGLRVDHLITHRFALSDANAAYADFDQGVTGKVLLQAHGRPSMPATKGLAA
jgi:2-desacetyl-2-hydroxyethyl bacteriochlorophyllide A dehydrogenase